jgi:hypothetical protein
MGLTTASLLAESQAAKRTHFCPWRRGEFRSGDCRKEAGLWSRLSGDQWSFRRPKPPRQSRAGRSTRHRRRASSLPLISATIWGARRRASVRLAGLNDLTCFARCTLGNADPNGPVDGAGATDQLAVVDVLGGHGVKNAVELGCSLATKSLFYKRFKAIG